MRIIPILILMIAMLACQPEKKDEEIEALSRLETELELQPSEERAKLYLDGLNKYVADHYQEFEVIQPYLKKGAKVSMDYGFLDKAPGFIFPLLKNKNTTDKLPFQLNMGDIMINLNKRHAADVIYKELARVHPNDPEVQKRKVLIDSVALAHDDYVQYLFDQILINPDEFGVNRIAALKFVDAAEALALINPDHPKTAEYLYKAAEVARGMRTMPKAMSIYDWILTDYPNYEKTATVLFIKGFIMEQDFKKADEARAIYTEFLERYPDHQMASSAKFLLENMGRSEEEILQHISKEGK